MNKRNIRENPNPFTPTFYGVDRIEKLEVYMENERVRVSNTENFRSTELIGENRRDEENE